MIWTRKHFKQQHLVFISVYTECSRLIFVNVFKFFPPNSLWGTFFNQSYFEVLQIKNIHMDFTSMYREGRIFPLGGIIKTTTVSIGSFVALLYRSSKITVVFFAYFALPQIYDIARFAVQRLGCLDW